MWRLASLDNTIGDKYMLQLTLWGVVARILGHCAPYTRADTYCHFFPETAFMLLDVRGDELLMPSDLLHPAYNDGGGCCARLHGRPLPKNQPPLAAGR